MSATTDRISFVVPGAPVPWERAGMAVKSRDAAKARAVLYTAKKTKDYQERVRIYAMQARQLAGWTRYASSTHAFELHTRFFLADLRGGNGGGGDVDNLAKSVSDACNSVLFGDDGRIVKSPPEKFLDRENPRAEVCVIVRAGTFIECMEAPRASFDEWAATR